MSRAAIKSFLLAKGDTSKGLGGTGENQQTPRQSFFSFSPQKLMTSGKQNSTTPNVPPAEDPRMTEFDEDGIEISRSVKLIFIGPSMCVCIRIRSQREGEWNLSDSPT